jgi:hypothetical protein
LEGRLEGRLEVFSIEAEVGVLAFANTTNMIL